MPVTCGTFNTRYQQDMSILRTKSQWALVGMALLFFVTIGFWLPADWMVWLIITCSGVIAVLGLHITTGLCGQFSMGQAAFVALGAYTTAILCSRVGLSPWLTLPLSGLVGGIGGAIFATPAVRIKGFYLVLSTMAAQFIVTWALLMAKDWTGGVRGISVPRLTFLGSTLTEMEYWWLTLALVAAAVFAAKNIQRTSAGRKFIAVRDNELAAGVLGIPAFRTKVLAFFIGSCFAGVAGWLTAHYYLHISPQQFGFDLSLAYLGMVIVGGMGSTTGAVLGAVAIRLVDKIGHSIGMALLASYPDIGISVFPIAGSMLSAITVMGFILFQPRGLYHFVQKFKSRLSCYPLPD